MKNFFIVACLLAVSMLQSCYKYKTDISDNTASFTILHCWAIDNSNLQVVTEDNRRPFNNKTTIFYAIWDGVILNGTWTYGMSSKHSSLVQVYAASDTTKPFFSKLIAPETDRRNNLLVSGTAAGPEFLYLDDHPTPPEDSSSFIRFVNMCPSLRNISVSIAGSSPGSEVSDLPYLKASSFKKYDARISQRKVVFEFRDKSTGDIVYTYPYAAIPFTNINICLRGEAGRWQEIQAIPLFQ